MTSLRGVFRFSSLAGLLLLAAGAAYPQLTITPSNAFGSYPLPTGFTTQAYPGATISTNGVGPTTWTVNGTLPPGLTLNPGQTSATITGTPTLGGVYGFTVSAFDPQFNQTVSQAYTINIVALLTITTQATPPSATLDTAYVLNFSATGGTPPYFWSVPAGYGALMPPGLQLSNTGAFYGTPTQAGSFTFLVQVNDSDDINPQTASLQVTLTVSLPPVVSGGGSLPGGTLGVAYQTTLSVKGGSPPIRWQLTAGLLPPGLNLINSGLITGTPTQAGNFSFTALAIDAWGASVSGNFSIAVTANLTITTKPPLTNGAVASPYSLQFAAVGSPPYTWSIVAGSLPAGLSLNASSGLLSGTPTAAGAFRFTVQVTDSTKAVASSAFPLTIAPQLMITTASLPNGKVGAQYPSGQSLAATGGTPPYRFFTGSGFPQSLNLDPLTGAITGIPIQAGLFTFSAEVTDSAGITASRTLTIDVTTIVFLTPSPLPGATLGVAYLLSFTVTGANPPGTFTVDSGNLPSGLKLETPGTIHGTPTVVGTFQFVVRITDAIGITTTQAYQLTVAPPTLPPPTITGVTGTGQSGQQPTGAVQLASSYSLDLTVTFTLAFASAEGNVDDPAIVFSNGTRTITVTIPAGTTVSPNVTFSTGTVAGTITLTPTFQAAGQDVTPNPAPQQVIQIPAAAPVITAVTAQRTSSGLEVDVSGFSNTRAITGATFQFQAGAGTNLQTSQVTISNAGQLFATWFSDATSQQYGSRFQYAQQFTISGNMTGITGVTVTLTNGQGTSSPATASVQ